MVQNFKEYPSFLKIQLFWKTKAKFGWIKYKSEKIFLAKIEHNVQMYIISEKVYKWHTVIVQGDEKNVQNSEQKLPTNISHPHSPLKR